MSVRKPSERLIVALDFPEVAQARALVARLGDSVAFYKIGMELAYGGTSADNGFALADELAGKGKKVFLDLKLHDIANTVQRATAQIARRGVDFLTVHAFPQTMAAAKAGAEGSPLKLLAVTVLTSYDDEDLAAAGYRFPVRDLVPHRAQQAKALGIDGLVAAASEAEELRRSLGPDMILVTPGIRPAGARPAIRSEWRRRRRRSPRGPIISSWGDRSRKRPIRAPQPRRFSTKSPRRGDKGYAEKTDEN